MRPGTPGFGGDQSSATAVAHRSQIGRTFRDSPTQSCSRLAACKEVTEDAARPSFFGPALDLLQGARPQARVAPGLYRGPDRKADSPNEGGAPARDICGALEALSTPQRPRLQHAS